MTDKEQQEVLKEVLRSVGRTDLIKQVGRVPDYEIIDEIKDLLPPEQRKHAYEYVEAAKGRNKTRDLIKYVKSCTKPSMPDQSLMMAMMKGIHPATYAHNKTLTLTDKLKLPVWECIYALNIKEDKNDNKTRRRSHKTD